MNHKFRAALCFWFSTSAFARPSEQTLPREKWGAPPVNISHSGGKWTIAGPKQSVSLNEKSFAIEIHAGPAPWAMVSNASVPQIGSRVPGRVPEQIRKICALQKRLAFVQMTRHKLLDPEYYKERTTFADGTTVSVDWNEKTVQIKPELN